jgi:hypothetical protein
MRMTRKTSTRHSTQVSASAKRQTLTTASTATTSLPLPTSIRSTASSTSMLLINGACLPTSAAKYPLPSYSSQRLAATSSSIALSSQGQAATTNSATTKHRSGRCDRSLTLNVNNLLSSVRPNHAGDCAWSGSPQFQPGPEPKGEILRIQISKFRVQGLEPSFFAALLQVKHRCAGLRQLLPSQRHERLRQVRPLQQPRTGQAQTRPGVQGVIRERPCQDHQEY